MFAPPFDHSFTDLFDEYVNMEASSADSNKDVSFPSDFDQIFSLDSLSSDCGDQSPIPTSKQTHPSPQWAKDFWGLPDASSSLGQGPLAFQDTVHPSAVSDLSVKLEASSTTRPAETRSSPATPPETPSRKSKSALVTPKSIHRHREPNGRRGVQRKQSFSPSLTRSSHLPKGRMAYPEAWAQRLQSFNFLRSSDDRLPLSPPPSEYLVQQENMAADNSAIHMGHSGDSGEMHHHFDSSIFNQSPAISMPSPSAQVLQRQQAQYLSHSNNSAVTPSPPSADDIFPSPHSSDPQSMSSWNSDTLGTPGLPFTPDLPSHDAQAWWPPMNARVPPRQPSYQQIVTSPSPQRPIQNTTHQHELASHQHDMLQGGLMIQMDPSSYDMAATASSSYSSTTMPPAPNPQENRAYNHMPPAHQKYVDASSFATPQLQPQSRSPSISPRGEGSPKDGSVMHHSITMKTARRNLGRKLSSNCMNSTPKPVKGLHGSGSPKGMNKSSVTVSFVNFTPSDSQKILTGVAPSGSSKTKARREQEARDRRRKLSEAALNAVRKAGGDVEALEAVLC
ncbi:hypothetical protein BDV23DRAFT_190804 [Aspergillus alliaceus]|uniref:Developmental regulatory protein wetA n=1 Tax=Petromyces alliaceus TaxID=209559 RepID=A0A5N7BV98_PETAA|nr:uncharacterized protein BDW43DRAFT_249796 [Aspergillus alliaceus]KAB8236184.1 hypothetical protein BDW43DRAFT_249796 [Aspergillus alliaceus]KAE8385518.1 hypothetical protein BDV23DRAFT_190804 [Aspergillus alliaceus]